MTIPLHLQISGLQKGSHSQNHLVAWLQRIYMNRPGERATDSLVLVPNDIRYLSEGGCFRAAHTPSTHIFASFRWRAASKPFLFVKRYPLPAAGKTPKYRGSGRRVHAATSQQTFHDQHHQQPLSAPRSRERQASLVSRPRWRAWRQRWAASSRHSEPQSSGGARWRCLCQLQCPTASPSGARRS